MEQGSYFGELALLSSKPRAATITVVSKDATAGGDFEFQFFDSNQRILLVLDVNAFERLLGPCKEVMSREIDKYAEEIAKLNL